MAEAKGTEKEAKSYDFESSTELAGNEKTLELDGKHQRETELDGKANPWART